MNSRALRHPDGRERDFWKIAHRGFSTLAPENTMASFQKALEYGADMVELDVTVSKDGVLYVFHDEKLERTTGGRGRFTQEISQDIDQLDAGRWFSSDFQGEKIPKLEDVLDRFGTRLSLNLEIKAEAAKVAKDMGKNVWKRVKERNLESHVVISSFDHGVITGVRGLSDEARLAALFSRPPSEAKLKRVAGEDLDFVHLHVKGLKEKHVRAALGLDLPVRVYTVNNACTIRSLRPWGVTGVFTDDLRIFEES